MAQDVHAAAPRVAGSPEVPVVAALLLAAAALGVLVVSLVSLAREVATGQPLTPYVAPQYWLSYRDGFARRALPGEVLRLLSGGDPSYAAVKGTGVGLSVAAVLAVVVLGSALARRVAGWPAALTVVAAVVVSPLGLSLYARDLGRTDAVGVVLVVLLAALPRRRLPGAAAALAVAVLSTTAVAAGEYLVAVVLPLGLVVARTAARDRSWPGWAPVAVAPCVVLAALSALWPPPVALLDHATAAARAAGVPPPRPMASGPLDHDAVSRLRHGFGENVTAYYRLMVPGSVVATTLLWAVVFLLVTGLVWHLRGRGLRERPFALLVAGYGLAALALSVAGIDVRRWWSLALVAALATVLRLPPGPGDPAAGRRTARTATAAALVVLALTGLLLQNAVPWPPRSLVELRALLTG